MGKVYGYIRVSSTDQHEDRQLIAMAERGIPQGRVYIDKQSGKDFARPRYRALIKKTAPRRSALHYQHRPSGTQLRRNSRAVALPDTRKESGHPCLRYAASRHAPRQRPHRYADSRHRFAGTVLRSPKRARKHQKKTGRRNRGGKGQRSEIREKKDNTSS